MQLRGLRRWAQRRVDGLRVRISRSVSSDSGSDNRLSLTVPVFTLRYYGNIYDIHSILQDIASAKGDFGVQLDHCIFRSEDIHRLIRAFRHTRLVKLVIYHLSVWSETGDSATEGRLDPQLRFDSVCEVICEMLGDIPRLRELDLSMNTFGAVTLERFGVALWRSRVQSFRCAQCNIDGQAMRRFTYGLTYHPPRYLRGIDFSYNPLGDEGVRSVFDLLSVYSRLDPEKMHISHVNLRDTRFSGFSSEDLERLQVCPKLKYLDIGGNDMREDARRASLIAYVNFFPSLDMLLT